MKLVTSAEMRSIEERAALLPPAGPGLSSPVLMEAAGLGIARGIEHVLAAMGGLSDKRVLVLAGPGNNGGDGLVVARHLRNWGADVSLYLWARRTDADENYAICLALGIPVRRVEADPDLRLLEQEVGAVDVVVDALLGTGRARPIESPLSDMLGTLREARQEPRGARPGEPYTSARLLPDHKPMVIAVDLPSGMNADTGEVDPCAVPADWTFTLANPKRGHYTYRGAAVSGRLEVVDIGIPAALHSGIQVEVATAEAVRARLPSRPQFGHKGTFGRMLVVGGCADYLGAPRLAATGAIRAGAGLVSIGAPSNVVPTLASSLLETTFVPLLDVDNGHVAALAAATILAELESRRALLIGPGLGQHAETIECVQQVLQGLQEQPPPGIVVDADGLNALAKRPRWWDWIPTDCVLTPHSGEMARLTGLSIAEIEADRIEVAQRLATRTNQVVVLKGAFTVIAAPTGHVTVSPFAVPALASAGTGDVLAGAIAGLLAQGIKPYDAAIAGVWLHASAGRTWSQANGDAGLAASDLLGLLPAELHGLRLGRTTDE